MTSDKKKPAVREPVQVYLSATDRKLLREVAAAAGVSGAEVLRRGLRRMAGEILSDRSPAMQLLEEMNAASWPPRVARPARRPAGPTAVQRIPVSNIS